MKNLVKKTKLRAGDKIYWRLRDGNVGFCRQGKRVFFDGSDDRHAIEVGSDLRITHSTAFDISALLAHAVGCRLRISREDKQLGILIYKLIKVSG